MEGMALRCAPCARTPPQPFVCLQGGRPAAWCAHTAAGALARAHERTGTRAHVRASAFMSVRMHAHPRTRTHA